MMEVFLFVQIFHIRTYLQKYKEQDNSENDTTIQISILLFKEKNNKQLILAKIVYVKGDSACICNRKSKKLQLKP